MNDRRPSDAQIAAALRAHLPAHAQTGLPGRVMDAVEITSQRRPLPSFLGALADADPLGGRRSLLIAAALLLGVALASAAAVGAWQLLQRDTVPQLNVAPSADLRSSPAPSGTSNGWIAYSTSSQSSGSDYPGAGSDIYLVREGVEPRLITGRDGGKIRNVCPAFSPDGRRLAYGVEAAEGWAVVVVEVDANGVISDPVRIPVPASASSECPRWSSDSTRVAYLDRGTVVVRGLDGSTPAGAPGDPRVEDFRLPLGRLSVDPLPLLSPSGDRTVLFGDGGSIMVARPDGTVTDSIPLDLGPYAIPAWSPDGRKILLMKDDNGEDFSMWAMSLDSPFDRVAIVSGVRTNGSRSWPGSGDVSWQPVFP